LCQTGDQYDTKHGKPAISHQLREGVLPISEQYTLPEREALLDTGPILEILSLLPGSREVCSWHIRQPNQVLQKTIQLLAEHRE
jgi:hypothetical protein